MAEVCCFVVQGVCVCVCVCICVLVHFISLTKYLEGGGQKPHMLPLGTFGVPSMNVMGCFGS